MKLGNRIYLILIFFIIFSHSSKADDKIITSPLINIEEIKPSFEELDEEVGGVDMPNKFAQCAKSH